MTHCSHLAALLPPLLSDELSLWVWALLEASCCVSNGVFVFVLWPGRVWPRAGPRSPGLSVKAGCSSLVTSPGTRKLGSLCSRPGSGLPQLSSSSESHPEQTWASWTLSTCHPWATPRARMQLQRYSECLLATNSCLVIKQKEKRRECSFSFLLFYMNNEGVLCL